MNTGIFGEGFPYSNFHDLNMDWIIKIAKDFLDQYTHIQEIIEQGKTDITELTDSGLEQLQEKITTGLTSLQDKADNLEALLQAWYDTHSSDIADQLASALADLNSWYTLHSGYLDQILIDNTTAFRSSAEAIASEVIADIPSDYTDLSYSVTQLIDLMKLMPRAKYIYSKNMFNKDIIFLHKYIDTGDGTLKTLLTDDCAVSGLIPVQGGETYYLYRDSNSTGQWEVRFIDRAGTPLKPINPSTGSAFSNYLVDKNIAITAPDNAEFIQFLLGWDIANVDLDVVQLEKGNTHTTYANYQLPYSYYDFNSLTPDLEMGYYFTGNMFNKNTIIPNKYIVTNTGAIQNYSGCAMSNLIPVKPNTVYTRNYGEVTGSIELRFVSEEGTPLKPLQLNGTEYSDYLVPKNVSVISPLTAKYAQFTLYWDASTLDLDDVQFVQGTALLNDTTYSEPTRVWYESQIDPDALYPLKGKEIVCMGDSLCHASLDLPQNRNGWAGRLAEEELANTYKYAVGGGSITYISADRFCISRYINTVYSSNPNLDYLILEGGVNDADTLGSWVGDVPPADWGTWTETDYTGSYDDTTFCGAVETMFYNALTKFPKAKVGFIVMMQMGTLASANRKRYFDEIVKIAKKWHIPVLNLWDNCPADARLSMYWDSTMTDTQNINAGHFYVDSEHITSYGYNKIQNMISEWIKTL